MQTPHKKVESPFGFCSSAKEVVKGISLLGKRTVVTGGSSGIGIETARALASARRRSDDCGKRP